jgi:hypothetical protein
MRFANSQTLQWRAPRRACVGWLAPNSSDGPDVRDIGPGRGTREGGQAGQFQSRRRAAGLQRSFSGRALLIFPEIGSLELMRAILDRQLRPEDILDLEDEALAETGNIILNSWVATIANVLKQGLKMSLPSVIRRDQRHIFDSSGRGESCILFVHVKFEISDLKVQGYVAIMMDVPSIEQLRSLIAAFLKSLNSENN